MKNIRLAWLMLWRDARAGELSILLLALLLAVTSTTTVALFSDRLQRTFSEQLSEFLAADAVIESSIPMARDWFDEVARLGLRSAESVEFSSVLMEGDELLLVSVKAVSNAYPLRGALRVTRGDFREEQVVARAPKPGEVWVERRVLSALHKARGDTLQLGEATLRITEVLTYEPDKRGDFYSMSPRVMMALDDLPRTAMIQPGSHVHRFLLLAGPREALRAFTRWLKPQLTASQRLLDFDEDRPELSNALARAERYLALSSMIVVLIAGAAIAMAVRRYVARHFDNVALWRCLGASRRTVLAVYGMQFLLLGVAGGIAGGGLGWVLQEVLVGRLRALLPAALAPVDVGAGSFGIIIGVLCLFAFALPPLWQLGRVTPLRVLRRDVTPLPPRAIASYGLALGLAWGLAVQHTGDVALSSAVLGGTLATCGLLGVLLALGCVAGHRVLHRLPWLWRMAWQSLTRTPTRTTAQVLALALTLAAMWLSYTTRTGLLVSWQQQLPAHAPNHFVLNVFPEQVATLQQWLAARRIDGNRFYPVVRGRLIAIEGVKVQRRVSKDSRGERATQRDLSLTWSAQLPEDNQIVHGTWWSATSPPGLVSVEQKLAESLQLRLGDRLDFSVGSALVSATVASIRALDWDTMRPNFFMIFSPGTLDRYPATYLSSFYLPLERKDDLNALIKDFPSMTILEVDAIVRQLQGLIGQLTQALEGVLYLALAAGVLVILAAVQASLDERMQTAALLRALGANRRTLQILPLVEFLTLGACAGVLAGVIAESVTIVLYARVLDLPYQPHYDFWWGIPLASAVLVAVAGIWGLRNVWRQAPWRVLREI